MRGCFQACTLSCVSKFCKRAALASVTALLRHTKPDKTRLLLDVMPLLICLPWSNRPHHEKNCSLECVRRVLSYNSPQSLHLSERALTLSLISLVVTKELSRRNQEHQSIHEGLCFHNAASTVSRNTHIRGWVKMRLVTSSVLLKDRSSVTTCLCPLSASAT